MDSKPKVLILCNDFPPVNSIGAERPYSWYKYFHNSGYYPIIITKNQIQSKDALIHKNLNVHCERGTDVYSSFIQAAASVVAMVSVPAIIVFVAGGICCLNAPTVVHRHHKLSSQPSKSIIIFLSNCVCISMD